MSLKLCLPVMQDKKSGTVNRSIKDAVLGYLRGYGYFVGEIYSAITTRFTS
jgi:hypothetical protein